MTDEQIEALTSVLDSCVTLEEPDTTWNDKLICEALKLLFDSNVITPVDLAMAIHNEHDIYISPSKLENAANGYLLRRIKNES